MILFLLLLIAALALVGVYAGQNPGTQDVNFLNLHFHAVANWLPVVAAAAAVALLFILYMLYSGAVHAARTGSLRRRVTTHESAIADLRKENQRLREENARMRSEMRGVDRGAATVNDRDTKPAYNEAGQRNYPTTDTNQSEVVHDDGTTTTARRAEPYQPRPSVGERVRSFFSGRDEPAGY
jgi:cell division protein FtsB